MEDYDADTRRKVREGYVEVGWTPKAWAARLRQMAERCEANDPRQARMLRLWASRVDQRRKDPPPPPAPREPEEIPRY